MGWTKLDSGWPRNPKVLTLSAEARVADITAWCFCSEQLTDGWLPPGYLSTVPPGLIDKLVEAGRFDRHEDGTVWVHDYLEYNPSKDVVHAVRDARSSAARSRWSKAKSKAKPPTSAVQDAQQSVLGDGTVRGSRGLGGEPERGATFADFWAVYPKVRRQGNGAAQTAWKKALTRASAEEILAGAERFAADPNLPLDEPKMIPMPATWLNQDRWLDDPLPARSGRDPRPRDIAGEHMAEAFDEFTRGGEANGRRPGESPGLPDRSSLDADAGLEAPRLDRGAAGR